MSLSQRIEAKWIDSFVEVFRLCGVQPGDACAILSETQSRAALVQLSELALARLGARWFHVVCPSPRQTAPVGSPHRKHETMSVPPEIEASCTSRATAS